MHITRMVTVDFCTFEEHLQHICHAGKWKEVHEFIESALDVTNMIISQIKSISWMFLAH